MGIVDWSGGARGPRGFDLGWCRIAAPPLAGSKDRSSTSKATSSERRSAAAAIAAARRAQDHPNPCDSSSSGLAWRRGPIPSSRRIPLRRHARPGARQAPTPVFTVCSGVPAATWISSPGTSRSPRSSRRCADSGDCSFHEPRAVSLSPHRVQRGNGLRRRGTRNDGATTRVRPAAATATRPRRRRSRRRPLRRSRAVS